MEYGEKNKTKKQKAFRNIVAIFKIISINFFFFLYKGFEPVWDNFVKYVYQFQRETKTLIWKI